MENLTEKLQEIRSDFKKLENPTQEDIAKFKQRGFDLFGEIKTLMELCQYYWTDMEIDGMPQEFITGMYSGAVNGAMFVINEIKKTINNDENVEDLKERIEKKLNLLQGL